MLILVPKIDKVDTFGYTNWVEGDSMHSEVKRWGNSAAVRLSSKILAQANLSISSPIQIEVQDGKIIIEQNVRANRKVKLPFSEAELLKGLDNYGAHGDELAQPLDDELGD